MKKRNYFKGLVLVLTSVLMFSCGSSDDDGTETGGGNGNEPQVTSISINANTTTIDLGGTIAFTVKDNNNVTVSVQSTIYFDGSEISGFVHTPQSVGVFQAHATYEGFTSPSVNITVNEPPRVVYASSDSYTKLLGEGGFTFTALTNGGENITSEAIFYIDGVEISGNEFAPTERGRYALTALYDGVTSDEIFVTIGYVQKVLVEDYTGAWCGYCPRLAYNLEEAENGDVNVIGVAIHNGDAMTYEYEANLRAEYGITGFPSGRINRNLTWNESVSQIEAYTGVNGNLGLGLETSLSGATVSVNVKVAYVNTVNNAKIVVYLTEDNLIYPQVNYMNNNSSSPWYQTGNPIVNFVHNNVLRKTATDIFGDAMPNAVDGDEYSEPFSFSVPASVQNTDNLEIVAFIIGSNGTVINSQRVSLGDSQDYQ